MANKRRIDRQYAMLGFDLKSRFVLIVLIVRVANHRNMVSCTNDCRTRLPLLSARMIEQDHTTDFNNFSNQLTGFFICCGEKLFTS